MRAFRVTAPGALELVELEPPTPGPGEIVLQVEAALTCGTDLKLFRRGHPKMPFPTRIGHEFAGRVIAAGEGARFSVGEPVMSVHTAPCGDCFLCEADQENLCDEAMRSMTLGGFAEQLLLPAPVVERNAFPKPDHLPYEHAAFLEPLSCCVQGIQDIGLRAGETVVVLGAGPIGLFHQQLARAAGASKVVMVGRREPRLQAARDLGADLVIDEQAGSREETVAAVLDATDGRGADVVIECVGQPEGWELAIDFARKGGRVLWFGGCKPGTEVRVDTKRVHYDQITLMGIFHFAPRAVAEARRLLVEGELDIAAMLSGTMPLDELPQALDLIGRGAGVKYALLP
ncbi:MAG: zinc-binding dehydrogenase [Acidobacteriota bacterium]